MADVFARLSSRAIALSLGALLLVAGCSLGGGTSPTPSATDVTVWTAWGGQELAAYQKVLKPFQDSTGIKVHLITIRDSATQLSINVAAGTSLPDIAPGPTIDKIQDWATKGIMKPLETFMEDKMSAYLANTYPSLTSSTAAPLYIGVVNGKHYELMVKTQVKGLIWYNKKVFTGTAPKTFDDLLAIQPPSGAKLFCAGLESGDASGWPASDQIDNIIMRQSGDKVYLDWIAGKVKFTSPEIKLGFQTYLKEVSSANVYGGPNTVLSTNFQHAGKPLFSSPPGCLFLEQATFITNFFTTDYPNLQAGTDYAFFPHPSLNSQYDGNVNGFYDNFAMYNDTPAARKLMQYMATKEAQQTWVDQGGTLAANKLVTKYPDPILQQASTIVAGAKNVLVTAGDFMPSDMQHGFWKGLLDATNNPSQLDSILAHLDQIQAAAYAK
jgi:alpha-glucoside transport system substrate-binding protein